MSMRLVKPSTEAEKQTGTVMDTLEITKKLIDSWENPPFQRPLRVNEKVLLAAEEIKRSGGVLPGILTIGVLSSETYVVDGQHRLKAFEISGLEVGYADVRTHYFKTMGDMAEEFVSLNSRLVNLKPDDILRGLEPSMPQLQFIRKKCPFVGYDMIRRGERSPILSMSSFMRAWQAARMETPVSNVAAQRSAEMMDGPEAERAAAFARICFEAWGRDREYSKLWAQLNFVLCFWLYRRLVLGESLASSRVTRLSEEDFRKALMSLSADEHYLDWLVGRYRLSDRDRGPAFGHIKRIISKRLLEETGRKPVLPQPTWQTSH